MSTDSTVSEIDFVDEWVLPDRLSTGELADCRGARRDEHVAARALAKALVVHALGEQFDEPWDEIEVRKDDKGRPFLELSGEVRKASHRADWNEVFVSWSHTDETVAAILWATTKTDQRPGDEEDVVRSA